MVVCKYFTQITSSYQCWCVNANCIELMLKSDIGSTSLLHPDVETIGNFNNTINCNVTESTLQKDVVSSSLFLASFNVETMLKFEQKTMVMSLNQRFTGVDFASLRLNQTLKFQQQKSMLMSLNQYYTVMLILHHCCRVSAEININNPATSDAASTFKGLHKCLNSSTSL